MNEREKGGVPDDALIRTTLAGDDAAFGELVERYKGRALAVAVGIVGNGDDALDVVQDSFIKAYYKLKEFRFGSNFYTWFYRLVVNQAIDRWRKSARSAEVPFDESWLSEDASPPDAFAYPRTPEDLARNRELGDALQRAVRRPPGVSPGGYRPSGGGRDGVRRDRQGLGVFGGNGDVPVALRAG